MTPNKRKTAPDAATSKGGKGEISKSSIPSDSKKVKALNALGVEQRTRSGDIQMCPRCGTKLLNANMSRNPISYCADVHICRKCYEDEILRAQANVPPKPLETWDYVRRSCHEKR